MFAPLKQPTERKTMPRYGIPALKDASEYEAFVDLPLLEGGEPDVNVMCPPNRYWQDHTQAPWNAFWSSLKADWLADYPELADVPEDDVNAPWNKPEPDRVSANYIYPPEIWDGVALLWTPPEIVPLVKLDKPDHVNGKKWTPSLTWLTDRVERGWIEEDADPMSPAEMLTLARNYMAAILDALPLADRMVSQPLRVQSEHALNLGQIDLAKYIVTNAVIPAHLEDTRTAILALFP